VVETARARGPWIAGLILVALHVGLLFAFGGAALFSDTPYHGGDFDTHIEQTWRVIDGLEGWGKTWVYDVGLLAGYPNGTIFDADNKGWEIWTYLWTRIGLSRGLAFNLFIVTAHLAAPFVVFGCARLFGLSSRAALWSAGLAIGYWFFDSWCHWCWHIGMVSYAAASYLFLVPLALFWRWLEDRRPWLAIACAVSMAAVHLVHPYSFFMLAVPMVVMWLQRVRELGTRGNAVVVGIAVFTVLANLWWLVVAARFWHYILDSAFFGQATLAQLPADVFGVLLVPTTSGVIGTRTAFRWLAIVGGVLTLVRWRRHEDRSLARLFWPMAAALGVMFGLTYFGAYTPFAQIQPYRHALPLGLLGCVLAGYVVHGFVAGGALSRLERPARVAFGVLAVFAGLHLARDVIYFAAPLLPKPRVMPDGQPTGLSAFGTGEVYDYRMAQRHYEVLDVFVNEVDDGQGRFLVEGALFGEHLVWATDAQVLGGFTERNLSHSYANLFRWYPQGIVAPKELRTYLDRYAVHWVITTTEPARAPWWDAPMYAGILEKVTEHGPLRAYHVKRPTSLIMKGGGPNARVDASTNRIAVTGTDPNEDVVLRFHWLETLICTPDCKVEPRALPKPRVPFIRIPAPHPADFVVENAY